jgi:RNA polymerase sigma-70 factor, ECF subfamily
VSNDLHARFYQEIWPHAAMVLRTAQVLTRRHDQADDLAQEALIKAFMSIDKLRPNTNARAWILAILRNTHIDRIRAATARPAVSLDALPMELPAASEQSQSTSADDLTITGLLERLSDQRLIDALRFLPEDIAWTLLLVDVEGLDMSEAAGVMDIPPGTVKSRASRGRAMIKKWLTMNQTTSPIR